MAKKLKRQFHCQTCGEPCTIYNKGKKHRVLVCPRCGVLATNPFSIARGLWGATKGGIGSVPVVGGALVGATEGFEGKKSTAQSPVPTLRTPSNHYTTEERVRDALAMR